MFIFYIFPCFHLSFSPALSLAFFYIFFTMSCSSIVHVLHVFFRCHALSSRTLGFGFHSSNLPVSHVTGLKGIDEPEKVMQRFDAIKSEVNGLTSQAPRWASHLGGTLVLTDEWNMHETGE